MIKYKEIGITEEQVRMESEIPDDLIDFPYGSIKAVDNISFTVKPGEVFSFNGSVGDISTLSGYKQAYIIQDGKTVLGDGGGVCQVSTTMFRAALDAGLPIVERRAHSYRVGYYEQAAHGSAKPVACILVRRNGCTKSVRCPEQAAHCRSESIADIEQASHIQRIGRRKIVHPVGDHKQSRYRRPKPVRHV